ncbi:MAG TPA: MlaD family protein [Chitinophagales bacterium]|nr:MlaD family protein [Chitinophagales bacterium]
MITGNKRTVIVGIFIFIGLAFLIAGILAIGSLNKSFTKKVEITTVFDDVGGLQQGNNIWFSGVKIGTVKDMSFYDKSQVLVVMNIDEKSQPFIRKNAKAKISSDGLIGSKIIVIYGGTQDAPAIEEGDQLSVDKTFSTEDMINTLQKNNENILTITTDFKEIGKKIMDGDGTLGKLLNDKTLYNNLSAATSTLNAASDNAKKLTADLAAYTSKLQQKGGLANDLVTDTTVFNSLRATVVQLNQVATTAAEVVGNLKDASSDPNSPVGLLLSDEESGASLKTTIKNLETSSVKLNENLEAMQHNFLLRGYFKKEEKKEGEK